jgi:NADH:ubiquinone oxidoreductase subunit 3 (subunit A)
VSRRDREHCLPFLLVKYFLVAILFVLFDVEVISYIPATTKEIRMKAWSKWSYLWFSFVGFLH